MADWVTISSLATATGTLVLATATFASVRSGNRTARAAERSLQVGLRPLLIPSRLDDPQQKVMFVDDHWVRLSGGMGAAEVADGVVYLAMALRNSGNGIAVLDRWMFYRGRSTDITQPADTSGFRRLTRDLYIPADGVGFWQGAIRDPDDPCWIEASAAIEERRPITIDLLYGDYEGGQHTISRFALIPLDEGRWLAQISRHWNLDRADPR
jgi:hypothetical protein